MLRTSLRIPEFRVVRVLDGFLSSNAQDFIEEKTYANQPGRDTDIFLSSNAQDFIEDGRWNP